MTMVITRYETLVFDCDGVVLDSNAVKTQAFYQAALPYGEQAAKSLVEYHVENGGVSRYKKFRYFCENVLADDDMSELEGLLRSYAALVLEGLYQCESARGLRELRAQTEDARWLIVSGGDQAELRQVFADRGLLPMFDGGIFGSPDTKDEILQREIHAGNIQMPALFLGDSKYDYKASQRAGLDFVFLTEWTEVENWERWTQTERVSCKGGISDLLL